MSISKEFQQIMSDIESILSEKDALLPQQIGTNIVNSLTPSHYDTIAEIYIKYPELEYLEGMGADIEILSDDEIWPTAVDEIVDMFNQIKRKYIK
jgi:hypothetical protein